MNLSNIIALKGIAINVSSTSITDATATGRAVLTSASVSALVSYLGLSSAVLANTAATLSSLTTTGAISANSLSTASAAITGGTINSTSIGATTASTGAFTTLGVSGAVNLASTLAVTGTTTLGTTNVSGQLTINGNALSVNAGTLSSTASSSLRLSFLGDLTTNGDSIITDTFRYATAPTSDWSTAYHRIYRRVDVTNMGYVQFGSATAAGTFSVELGVSNASVLIATSSGVTLPFTLSVAGATSLGGNLAMGGSNAAIEIGSLSTVMSPYLDFHSSGSANDYDARIIATGGTSGTVGVGTLQFIGAALTLTGNVTVSSGKTFTAPSVTLSGGTIDATAIGSTTPSTGSFTNLTASGTVNFTAANVTAKNLNYTYAIPNNAGTAQWVNMGTFTAPQTGVDLRIKVVTSVGYNASVTQDSELNLHFKTSNGSSVDANGFAGDAVFFKTGGSTTAGQIFKVVSNSAGTAATSYVIWMYLLANAGAGSFYTVEYAAAAAGSPTWTNTGTLTATDPGVASSTICIATERMYLASPVTFNNTVGFGAQAVSGSNLALTGGSIDGMTVGSTTRAAGAFTTLAANGAVTFTAGLTANTAAISGGTVNATSVGATTPSTGAFTTASTSGLATLASLSTASATITGGSVNSTPVGATTASTGAFTTLSSSAAATLASLSTASATLTGGTINSTSVGATAPSTGAFTTLSTSGAATLASISSVSATLTGGTINSMSVGATTQSTGAFTTLTSSSTATLSALSTANATVTGGTINGVTIGATTPSSASFTTIASSGAATLNALTTASATLTGGTINGAAIGTTTPSTGAFTNLSATGTVSFSSANISAKNLNYTYSVPSNTGTSQWINLGTFTASQNGTDLFIKVITSAGFTASASSTALNTELYLHFKTSDGTGVDGNGFAGDAIFYKTGGSTTAGQVFKIVGNAAGTSATSYTVWMYSLANDGAGSLYTVEYSASAAGSPTWTNTGTLSATDPGVASSTVCIATERMYLASPVTFNNTVAFGANQLSSSNLVLTGGSINSTPIGATTASTGAFSTLSSSAAATLASLSTASATLTGGTINSMSVGATTPSTGAFTTISSSAAATLASLATASAAITGGSINSTPVGATTPSTGSFTSLASSGTATLSAMNTGNASISGGTINGTTIGATTPSTGAFTNLSASGTVTLSAINSTPIGATTPSTGAFTTLSSSGAATLSSISSANATLTGGTINGTSVGATTPSTGAFTNLSVSGTITLSSINSTPIGNTTPSTGAFTTLSSSGAATLASLSTASATLTGGTINATSVGATTPSTGSFTNLTATGTVSLGAINSTSIGATTPSTGAFTTLSSSAAATLASLSTASATLTGGTINNMTIGATTPSTVAATNISASGTLGVTGVATLSSVVMGSTAGTVGTTNKLALYGTAYGFGISSGSLDYVSGGSHTFYTNGTVDATLTSTGLTVNGTVTARNLNYTFALPGNPGAAEWANLGTFTAPQNGNHLFIKIVLSNGYNSQSTQDNEIYIHFKTANSSNFDANGFAGDAIFYKLGPNASTYIVKVVANAAGASAANYTIWVNFPQTYTGIPFYTVEYPYTSGVTWTNTATLTTTDPGAASSTISIATEQFNVASPIFMRSTSTFSALATFSAGLGSTSGTFSTTLGVTGASTLSGGMSSTTGSFSSTLGVTGLATLSGGLSSTSGSFSTTLGVTGLATLSGGLSATSGSFSTTLGVTGASTFAGLSATTGSFSSTLGVTGLITASGGITGAHNGTVGATTPSTGAFTTISASSTLGVTGAATLSGGMSSTTGSFSSTLGVTGLITASGGITGAHNGTVGATTPSTGAFTTISASSTLGVTGAATLSGGMSSTTGSFSSTLGVTGLITASGGITGAHNGTVGATTPSTGAFTTITASSTLGVTGATTLAGLSATTGSFSSTLGVTGLITASGGITGAHNGTVGASTPNTGAFTTLSVSSTLSVSTNASIGGTLGVTGAASFSSSLGALGPLTGTGFVNVNNTVANGGATFRMYNSAAATDYRYTEMYADTNGTFVIRFVNDAYTVGPGILTVSRSASAAVNAVNLYGATVTVNAPTTFTTTVIATGNIYSSSAVIVQSNAVINSNQLYLNSGTLYLGNAGTGNVNLSNSGATTNVLGTLYATGVISSHGGFQQPQVNQNNGAAARIYVDYGAIVNRINDRVFIGAASVNDGTSTMNGGKDWLETAIPLTTQSGQLVSICTSGTGHGLVGAARSSDCDNSLTFPNIFGTSCFVWNDNTVNGSTGTGIYSEGHNVSGRKVGAGCATLGGEIDCINHSPNPVGTADPYNAYQNLQAGACFFASGKPGVSTVDATTGVSILNNGSAFTKALIIGMNAVTGTDGVSGTGSAIALARGHQIEWYVSGQSTAPMAVIRSDMTTTVANGGLQTAIVFNEGGVVNIANLTTNYPSVQLYASSAHVNYVAISGNQTGFGPNLYAQGQDTNVNLVVGAKGSGVVYLNSSGYVNGNFNITGSLTVGTAFNFTTKVGLANQFYVTDSTQGTDAKTWDFVTSGGQLFGRAVNDAYNATSTWLAVSRSAGSVTNVNIYSILYAQGAFVANSTASFQAATYFSSSLQIQAPSVPVQLFYSSGNAADAKYWRFCADGSGSFFLQALNDALNGSNNALTFTRSAATITAITLGASAVVNGAITVSGSSYLAAVSCGIVTSSGAGTFQGQISAQGSTSGILAYERTGGTSAGQMYRSGGYTRLWDSSYGDAIYFGSGGLVNIPVGVSTGTVTGTTGTFSSSLIGNGTVRVANAVSGTPAFFQLYNTAAGTDQKYTEIFCDTGGSLQIRFVNDAYSSGPSIMTVTRASGANPNVVSLYGSAFNCSPAATFSNGVSITGNQNVSGAVIVQGTVVTTGNQIYCNSGPLYVNNAGGTTNISNASSNTAILGSATVASTLSVVAPIYVGASGNSSGITGNQFYSTSSTTLYIQNDSSGALCLGTGSCGTITMGRSGVGVNIYGNMVHYGQLISTALVDFQGSGNVNMPVTFNYRTSGQGADSNLWDTCISGQTLLFRIVNDAYNNAPTWMSVIRSGMSLSSIQMYAPLVVNSSCSVAASIYVTGSGVFSVLAGSGNRSVYADPSGTLTLSSSDMRLKTNREDMSPEKASEQVSKLKPLSFNWRDTSRLGAQREIGFYAQEVQEIIPEVIGSHSGDILTLDYAKLTATLVGAVQHLQNEVKDLRAELAAARA